MLSSIRPLNDLQFIYQLGLTEASPKGAQESLILADPHRLVDSLFTAFTFMNYSLMLACHLHRWKGK